MKKPWITCGLPFGPVYGAGKELPSFSSTLPRVVGLTIDLDNGDQYLIGDINPLGGVCDDCCEVRPERVVKRYR
jgi:hypothetical protein